MIEYLFLEKLKNKYIFKDFYIRIFRKLFLKKWVFIIGKNERDVKKLDW